jgi:hypothetical protein
VWKARAAALWLRSAARPADACAQTAQEMVPPRRKVLNGACALASREPGAAL